MSSETKTLCPDEWAALDKAMTRARNDADLIDSFEPTDEDVLTLENATAVVEEVADAAQALADAISRRCRALEDAVPDEWGADGDDIRRSS